MFKDEQDEQVICHVSGHRSNAVRTYKHISDDVRRSASESTQGKIKNNSTETESKLNVGVAETVVKQDIESDLDDVLPTKDIQTPLKGKFVLRESVSEVSNICDMITKVAS